jgi:IS1 family transposase
MANFLPVEKKILVLNSLVEGNSVSSVVRMTGVNKRTVLRLLCEAGARAAEILDREIVNLKTRYVQVDEIWAYIQKKEKRCSVVEKIRGNVGDAYTFVAIDSESKLVISYLVGRRTVGNAYHIMKDLQYRIPNLFQLSTDAFKPYRDVVDSVFGTEINYGQVHKSYAEDQKGEKRYSPAQIVSIDLKAIIGQPRRNRISTSHVERQNLTMRMNMRRFTRLTNAFSKKWENHAAAVALHFYHYNFMRIHQTLRVTPAMQAGVTKHVWTWEEFLGIRRAEKIAA